MKYWLTKFQDFLRSYLNQIIGFFGWFVINGLVYYAWLGRQSIYFGENWAVLIVTIPLNLLVLLVLAIIKLTRGLAFGMVVAIIINSIIFWVLGIEKGIVLYPFFSAW